MTTTMRLGSSARLAWGVMAPMLALGMTADLASAQYFGRNKVQYRTFDFRVLQTETFDVYFYPEEEAAARDAARMAERWYTRLSGILEHRFEERQPLIFYGSHPAFQQTTTLGGEVGEGVGGVTESAQQRVIMPLTGSYQETDHVLGHELVHAFQYDISGLGRSRGQAGATARALGSAPLWFIEGMAEYLSVGPVDPLTAMWIRDAALTGDIPSIERLTVDPRVFPYRWGHALWAYVGGRWGDAAIGQILRIVGEGVAYDDAIERVLNIEIDELSQDWQTSIRRTYLPLLAERPEAREIAEPLITRDREGGRLNIGPALSPNGEQVVFLSERGLDVELWLADATTGEVLRRLQKGTAFDSHFQSLRFINSAGSWAPDNEQFVFSALRGGQDRLVIVNTRTSRTVREIRIPDVFEIATPDWAPDGRTIVFSGISGGVSNLYSHDLESGETRKLTDDLFANLHPSTSPDGRTIAFVTDQGPGTDLETLRYGGYNLALLDVATGGVTLLPLGEGDGASINPVWGGGGSDLYFITNRSGIPNVYRIEVETGNLFQVTRLFGGVSGITETSPALSVARSGDRLLFTAFEANGYNIYSITTPAELAGTPITLEALGDADGASPAVLPPAPRPTEGAFNRVTRYLSDAAGGLPGPTRVAQWQVVPYSPGLHLDYLGQPTVGVSTGGVSGVGGLYGGIAAVFSDVLGYHTVFGAVQAQGELDEIGVATQYINQKYRWNWGAGAQRVPYISLSQRREFEPEPGDPDSGVLSDQILKLRYFDTSLKGLTQYPFSRSRRFELSAGYRRLARDIQVVELRRAVVQDGQLIGFVEPRRPFELEGSGQAWNMGEATAALVYDNSLFGFTSPFAGQRYRFEVNPVVGSISYVQALADYRRYQWWRPFTAAVQALHFGRYGSDVDQFFFPIFLGQPSLVRGYWSVYSDCRTGRAECDSEVLEQMFGSRIAVGKAELRFPLIRQLVIGPIGFPPIEGFAFGDAGVAWDRETSPRFTRFTRDGQSGQDPTTGEVDPNRYLLTSAGVGARLNLFGYVIIEANYVNAFQRDRGWHWQFALQPGF
jgi:hypothetical protein